MVDLRVKVGCFYQSGKAFFLVMCVEIPFKGEAVQDLAAYLGYLRRVNRIFHIKA